MLPDGTKMTIDIKELDYVKKRSLRLRQRFSNRGVLANERNQVIESFLIVRKSKMCDALSPPSNILFDEFFSCEKPLRIFVKKLCVLCCVGASTIKDRNKIARRH